ncbi:hypothetical protein [Paraburkholderia saeva]|uniref:Uncharacterized protein n=1 Tax=Paraburkholderia saeva TaxID=2777537 RepID=A0A9N8RXX5_9BURK|nr:hypothetical protein [Paraburkholderia saeva]CAG4900491.1 hypothetical protein LMG31841_02884 [Paraburkholderia saeva]
MAKHTITIEDLPDGAGVWITSDPSVEETADLCRTPDRMTSADGYAAVVHAAIIQESRRAKIDEQRTNLKKSH